MSHDLGRIKRNIAKMIDMDAPEADIDAYIQEEGITLAELQGSSPSSDGPKPLGRKPTGRGGYNSETPVIGDAKAVIQALFPGIAITDFQRDPNSELGKKNPNSWHNHTAAAVDVRPPQGMSYDQFLTKIREAGFPIVNSIDEVKNPSGHATGPHWHIVLGPQMEGYPPVVSGPPQESPADNGPSVIPEAQAATPKGDGPTLSDLITGNKPERSFFSAPTWNDVARGTGSVVEGLADIPGMVVDPVNTLIARAMGYDNYTSDIGKTIREGMGLPKVEGLAGQVIEGGANGLGFAGASRVGSRLATGAVQKALTQMSATPFRDTVAGGTAALGAEGGRSAADAAGLGETGQFIASLAGSLVGGVGGYLAPDVPKVKGIVQDHAAGRWAEREAANNPRARFEAEAANDIIAAAKDPNIAAHAKSRAPKITTKILNDVGDQYTDQMAALIKNSDLHPADKRALEEALMGKHSLRDPQIEELIGHLGDTVQGRAVVDGIRKSQALRKLTEPHGRTGQGLGTKLIKGAGEVADMFGVHAYVGRGLRAIASKTGDVEMARLAQSQKVAQNAKRYTKLQALTGPSGAVESKSALREAARAYDDGNLEAQAAQAAERASAREAAGIEREQARAYKADRKANVKMDVENDPELARRAGRIKAADDFIKASEREANKFELVPETVPVAKEPTQRDMSQFRRELEDPAPDMRDVLDPVPTPRALASRVKSRNDAISKMENNATAWDEALADPSTAPKPKAVAAPKAPKTDPIQDSIDAAVKQGLRGDSGVQNSFTGSLGLSADDLLRTIEAARGKVAPELHGELDRIALNHPTRSKMAGTALRPHLRSAMEELGITPKTAEEAVAPTPVPVDEAAQARLETKAPEAPAANGTPVAALAPREAELLTELDKVNPVRWEDADGKAYRDSDEGMLDAASSARVAELEAELKQVREQVAQAPAPRDTGPYNGISRPKQWEQGKERRVGMANDAIHDLYGKISPETGSIITRMPEHIRTNIKTGDEARSYIESTVIPELQAGGASPQEIDSVRTGLYEIADYKPHQTQEAYDAALAKRGRGRPKNQN